MLKLKYLFNNKDLAKMILDNWEYEPNDPNLFEYFRISSNAIYWFRNKGKGFILRFAPACEKSKESVLAELDFTRYLRNNEYPVVETVPSKNGNHVEHVHTPWGEYHACVFVQAPGMEISRLDFSEQLVTELGRALGKLHNLSSCYKPAASERAKRESWIDKLNWINDVLSSYPDQSEAKAELAVIQDKLSSLPQNEGNYGLIHFDFEPDNILFDAKSGQMTVIDFDDSMYNWYVADICIALESMKDEFPQENLAQASALFIEAYRSVRAVSDAEIQLQQVFHRFTLLYGYARILAATAEKWDNEPEWLVVLRKKLADLLVNRSIWFGKPLV